MTYQKGQALTGGVARVRAVETEPPQRYTEGTLITAMTSIHLHVPNEADRKVLKNARGIGTERTRDSMIEKLKKVQYLGVRKKGSRAELHPTDLAMELIERLPPALADPATTAKWEMALGLIAEGKVTKAQFLTMIRNFTCEMVETLKGVKFDVDKLGGKAAGEATGRRGGATPGKAAPAVDDTIPGHGAPCEKCGTGSMKGVRFASGKRKISCTNFRACKNEKWIE